MKKLANLLNENSIHGSVIAVGGHGVLLLGPSGSGKSDMALRLIDSGAVLVADDRVMLEPQGGHLIASAPEKLRGLIEIRGAGVYELPHEQWIPLRLVVKLVPAGQGVPRYPEEESFTLFGIDVPVIYTSVSHASAPATIRAVLNHPRIETLVKAETHELPKSRGRASNNRKQ